MRVRIFTGQSVQEAMNKVKLELGREAVILHTRRFKTGGMLGLFGNERVEVMAAVDDALLETPAVKTVVAPAMPTVAEVIPPQQTHETVAPVSVPLTPAKTAEPEWKQELAEMRSLLERALHESKQGADAVASAAVEKLLQADVLQPVAESLVRQDPVLYQWKGTLTEPAFTERLERLVEQGLGKVSGVALNGSAPHVVALLGPTGVGKTTTIAKLAAYFSLQKGIRVSLITADTYRISAVEQLKTYAEIMGLQLEIVYAPQELAKALAKCKGSQLVLLDTAGRSPKNQEQLEELQLLLSQVPQAEKHLVLSLTTCNRDALEIAKRFSVCSPDKVLFTKLDEASRCGVILNVLQQFPMKLSYVTNGQNVPDDLQIVSPAWLAKELLRGDDEHV
ncbi:flagellar biosynthesis protein FlhF [Anaeromusa sp.]|uniref:flagellar biosynthesis protein FlhF n=1 Tax=Anaeromusa sp. TaxID=1872520 RepID=UPI002621F7E2|nr:flagellar biosynthesis protein FlhF [Anaeromusa sp.]MDD3159114.1 flagellar biosynthesis protein FlhF [Anaeromusa sp.]